MLGNEHTGSHETRRPHRQTQRCVRILRVAASHPTKNWTRSRQMSRSASASPVRESSADLGKGCTRSAHGVTGSPCFAWYLFLSLGVSAVFLCWLVSSFSWPCSSSSLLVICACCSWLLPSLVSVVVWPLRPEAGRAQQRLVVSSPASTLPVHTATTIRDARQIGQSAVRNDFSIPRPQWRPISDYLHQHTASLSRGGFPGP